MTNKKYTKSSVGGFLPSSINDLIQPKPPSLWDNVKNKFREIKTYIDSNMTGGKTMSKGRRRKNICIKSRCKKSKYSKTRKNKRH